MTRSVPNVVADRRRMRGNASPPPGAPGGAISAGEGPGTVMALEAYCAAAPPLVTVQ